MRVTLLLLSIWVAAASLDCRAQPDFAANQRKALPAADLIVINAKIWTVDKAQPRAEAVAVIGDRIVAVSSSDEINSWRGPNTRVIDAGGKLLL
jgi:adenine deaminase